MREGIYHKKLCGCVCVTPRHAFFLPILISRGKQGGSGAFNGKCWTEDG